MNTADILNPLVLAAFAAGGGWAGVAFGLRSLTRELREHKANTKGEIVYLHARIDSLSQR